MTEILGFLTLNPHATEMIGASLAAGFAMLHLELRRGRRMYRAGE